MFECDYTFETDEVMEKLGISWQSTCEKIIQQ